MKFIFSLPLQKVSTALNPMVCNSKEFGRAQEGIGRGSSGRAKNQRRAQKQNVFVADRCFVL